MMHLTIPEITSQVLSELNKHRRFIITTHVNPDADAIGSALGMKFMLELICGHGTEVTIVLPSPCPSNLQWMPGSETMLVWSNDQTHSNACATLPSADCIIVLDLNTLSRLHTLGEAIAGHNVPIINIDHHTYPENFSDIQWIDTTAASTTQLVATLLLDYLSRNPTQIHEPPVHSASACLYAGVMSDTGSFRFPRTTPFVFELAAWLVAHGADPVAAYENTYNTNSFKRTQLLGKALSGIQLHHDGKVCTLTVSQHDLDEYGCTVEDTEGLVHHTLTIEKVVMGILFIELPGLIKCSFRSKGTVYIRDLAAEYGGGGHVYASGAKIPNRSLQEVTAEVIAKALAYL